MTSPLRAQQDLKNALIKRYAVKNGVTLLAGQRVRFGTSDHEVDLNSGADDDTCIGTAMEGGVATATDATWIDVCLDGTVILPMTVGTGGSTRGAKQKLAADGITDAPANGGGNVAHTIVGIAMQTGVATDSIGVMIGGGSARAVSAA